MSDYSEILVSLRRITRAIDLHSKKLVRESGLTAPQLRVLQSVEQGQPIKPSAIARDVRLSHATVTVILTKLSTLGLIERKRSDTDRRAVDVSLTDHGRKRLSAAPSLLQDNFVASYNALEDWEQKFLLSALLRIASMMDAEHLDAAPILELGDLQADANHPEVHLGN